MGVIQRAISNFGDTRDEGGIGYRQVGVFPLNPLHPNHGSILPRSQSLIHGPANGVSIGDRAARDSVRRGKPGVPRHHVHEVTIRIAARVRRKTNLSTVETGAGDHGSRRGLTVSLIRQGVRLLPVDHYASENNQPDHANHGQNGHQDPCSL